MPITKSKNKNMRQLVASLIVDEDIPEGKTIYVVKTPRADAKHVGDATCVCYTCHPTKNGGLSMYGLSFTDGVAITTDKELAERITSEFPDYHFEELA